MCFCQWTQCLCSRLLPSLTCHWWVWQLVWRKWLYLFYPEFGEWTLVVMHASPYLIKINKKIYDIGQYQHGICWYNHHFHQFLTEMYKLLYIDICYFSSFFVVHGEFSYYHKPQTISSKLMELNLSSILCVSASANSRITAVTSSPLGVGRQSMAV